MNVFYQLYKEKSKNVPIICLSETLFHLISLKLNAIIYLSKSPSACDICLFSVSAWASEGKDYYRGSLTDAEALSLAFPTSDVPLIVRKETACTSIHYFCYFIQQPRQRGAQVYDFVRRIPSPFLGLSSLLSPSSSKIIRQPALTSATVATR